MDLTQMIAQVGFPIAVAAWLLLKMEKQLESAADVGRRLASLLEAHLARCQECQERRFGLAADNGCQCGKEQASKPPISENTLTPVNIQPATPATTASFQATAQ